MSKPITKVNITSFRGATTNFGLDFDPRKTLTMLFGENGSGKSSILDAIDVAVNGGTGGLADISAGAGSAKYLCSLGNSRSTLRSTVYSGTEEWSATMPNATVSVSGPTPKPRIRILRRSKLLQLIVAQPSERYAALKRFIDIETVESSENALRQKRTEVENEVNRLSEVLSRLRSQLDQLWQAEGRPGPGTTAFKWAESKVAAGIENLSSDLTALNDVLGKIATTTQARGNYATRTTRVQTCQVELSRVNTAIRDAPDVPATEAVALVAALTNAQTYIEAETALDRCPTCLRLIDRDELMAIVGRQLTAMQQLRTLADQQSEAQSQLNIANANLTEATTTLDDAVHELNESIIKHPTSEVTQLNITWPDWTEGTPTPEILTNITDRIATVEQSLTDRRNIAQRDVNQFTAVQQSYKGIVDATQQMSDLDRIRNGLNRAYVIAHKERVDFVQNVLDEIKDEANRLYQIIHPGEDIGLDGMTIEENRRGSVSQTGEFYGHTEILPQAVFSESHMDTLGFCIWLALAKRTSPEDTVLLIDDIFTSVDGPHLTRIVDLLADEGDSFLQIIIATHFRLWWDRCGNANNVQRIHLGQWSKDNGIYALNMPLLTTELRRLVEESILDRQAVSSKAGILLENILDGLALLYRRSLPRNRDNMYTLDALLGAASPLFSSNNLTVRVNINWDVDGEDEDWQQTQAHHAYDRVNALSFIRNQVGCHFNPPGTEIPDDDVREFGRATVELFEATTCPNCGTLATKVTTDGTALRCTCRKRAIRMTPVTI